MLEERYLEPESFINQLEVVKLFLQYGADSGAMCNMKDGRELTADTIVRESLLKYPHPATGSILALLDTRESVAKPKSSMIQKLSSWSAGRSKSRGMSALI